MKFFFYFLKTVVFGHKKLLSLSIVSLCFLFLFSSGVLAIGVSPPVVDIDYNQKETFSFDLIIFNNGNGDGIVSMQTYGDLDEYVSLSEYQFSFKRGVKAHKVTVTIALPEYNELTVFGKQKVNIYIEESSPDVTGTLAFQTAVKAVAIVDIPVPGKLGEIDTFTVSNTNKGYGAPFTLILENKGIEDLYDTSVKIEIRDYKDVLMGETTFNDIDIPADDSYTITDVLSTQSYDSSKYHAIAKFTYDPQKASLEKLRGFFVGSTDIALLEYTPELTPGKINKITLDLQSLWGSPLKNIRGTLTYAGQSQQLPVIDFEVFELKQVDAFLDIPVFEEKPATLDATLELEIPVDAETIERKSIPLTFSLVEEKKPGLEFPINGSGLVIAGLVLALLLVVGINIFIFVKKKHDKKN